MKKENFVKKIEEIKRENQLDLSIGEDLSVALMNIISLEEHFLFSYMKTSDNRYLDFLENTRELRKKLMLKIVKRQENDYSEKWCISKHLLATSMRLTEIGTKFLHDGKKTEAGEMFEDAFEIYSMFWSLNGFIEEDTIKSDEKGKTRFSIISDKLKGMLDCCKE